MKLNDQLKCVFHVFFVLSPTFEVWSTQNLVTHFIFIDIQHIQWLLCYEVILWEWTDSVHIFLFFPPTGWQLPFCFLMNEAPSEKGSNFCSSYVNSIFLQRFAIDKGIEKQFGQRNKKNIFDRVASLSKLSIPLNIVVCHSL